MLMLFWIFFKADVISDYLMQGIRKICFELLDLKDAVENLCSNTRTKYLAFLR